MVVQLIKNTREKAGKRLGTKKVYHVIKNSLRMMKLAVGRDKFYEIARANNLIIKPKKKRRAITTDSSAWRRQHKDLRVDLVPDRPEQLFVSDITYIRLTNNFVYLSLITDAYSRRIMGWHLHEDLSTTGCLIALRKALKNRIYPDSSLIHHSDRGCQYCSGDYVKVLKEHDIAISMTQNGSPYENALAESVNGQLKVEYDLDATFETFEQATQKVETVIHQYNELRPHGSIDMEYPAVYHRNFAAS